MCSKNSVLPQANIYSSKKLFDKLEDRNQKRLAQMIKRKNILLSKNNNFNKIKKEKSSEQMITPSTQDISTFVNNTNNTNNTNNINNTNNTNNINNTNNTINNILNLSKTSIKEENFYNGKLLTSKSIEMKRFLSLFKYQNKNKNKNSININNFNILDEDSEKEINISSLNDNDNFIDNYIDKEKNIYNKNNKDKNVKNNLNRCNDSDNENENNIKDKYNICQRNKYAIEFLSSSADSFVELKNKLITKAKYNKNYFTQSYSQALFLDYNNSNNKIFGKDKTYNYEVNDIIKEENEPYSPKQNNKFNIRQSKNIISIKKKNIKNSIKLMTKKMPNKSFCKTAKNYLINKNNLIKSYNFNFNKNLLINNCKLKFLKVNYLWK